MRTWVRQRLETAQDESKVSSGETSSESHASLDTQQQHQHQQLNDRKALVSIPSINSYHSFTVQEKITSL